jgi:hypothetical protein
MTQQVLISAGVILEGYASQLFVRLALFLNIR